ncbi:hypothetical protein EU97_0420 [Prochlorococcus marinus str. MIT 9311]|nr:hypothetical protein EU97_0420 [Prochlorococcus marinus str. MIT 9311]
MKALSKNSFNIELLFFNFLLLISDIKNHRMVINLSQSILNIKNGK